MGPTDLLKSVILCTDNYFRVKDALKHHEGCKKEPAFPGADYLPGFFGPVASAGGKLMILCFTASMK